MSNKGLLADETCTVAVSGLKTGENPQPGVPVIRSIRNAGFKGKIVGLAYDSLESGIYVAGCVDSVYQMPYPSNGATSFLNRIDYILKHEKIDVIIPTLDSEIITYIRLEQALAARGIKTYLPEEEHLAMRDKKKLFSFFAGKDVSIPPTMMISTPEEIATLHALGSYPLIVKGCLYEAYFAYTAHEVYHYFQTISSKWGLPVIVQKVIVGDEFNVVLIGDGRGDIIGMIPQRKVVVTDKGKGFAGVVVNNPKLDVYARTIIRLLKWRGPCELEIIQDRDGVFYLIEINPRFPAWVRLAEGAGQNLPAAAVALALGRTVEKMTTYKAGTLFIRHAEDIIADIAVMGRLSAQGDLLASSGVSFDERKCGIFSALVEDSSTESNLLEEIVV